MKSNFTVPSVSTIHNECNVERMSVQVELEQLRDEMFAIIKQHKRPMLTTELPIHQTKFGVLAARYPSVFKCVLRHRPKVARKYGNQVTIVTLSNNDKRFIDGWTDFLEPFGPIIYGSDRDHN